MMELFRSLQGTLRLQIISADIYGCIQELTDEGVILEQLQLHDAMQMELMIHRRDYPVVRQHCEKRNDHLEILERQGLRWMICGLWRRPVLVIGMLFLLFLAFWTPGRVFFVLVEGNEQIPSNLILEQAQLCGVGFGQRSRVIRSEKVKNELLENIPQLQWVGVNTQGCIAVISVREKQQPNKSEQSQGISSIVALRDGVIQEITVLNGSAQCVSGQTVRAGQVLISGFMDCGLTVRGVQAQGEVYAQTSRAFSAVLLTQGTVRTEITAQSKNYSLMIGKKRIKFNNNSGISGGECVRIYSEQYLTLPGGFRLPIALCVEQVVEYALQEQTHSQSEEILVSFMTNYVQSQMIAGRILTETSNAFSDDGYCRIDAVYGCYEMIGLVRPEERLDDYENHGTNSKCRTA